MIKKALLVVAILFAGNAGLVSAQSAATIAVKKVGHARIFELRDRINSQLSRIDQGVADNELTAAQAQACRAVLTDVTAQMQAEHKANGPKRIMSMDRYIAYNASLDENSALIHEEKGSYYYYGTYYDQHAY